MAPIHPIDTEIRAWLKTHAGNHSELSLAVGHGNSWLHKYVNGSGHATIDDLVRVAGLLFGLNLPALTELEQKLLAACRGFDEPDLQDVIAYAKYRAGLAPRAPSKESSARAARKPRATKSTARGTQRVAGE